MYENDSMFWHQVISQIVSGRSLSVRFALGVFPLTVSGVNGGAEPKVQEVELDLIQPLLPSCDPEHTHESLYYDGTHWGVTLDFFLSAAPWSWIRSESTSWTFWLCRKAQQIIKKKHV